MAPVKLIRGLLIYLLMILFSSSSVVTAAQPAIADLSDNTVRELSPAAVCDADISFAGGENYADGYIRYSLAGSTTDDTFSLTDDPDPDAAGAISHDAEYVYLGNGSGKDVIAIIDEAENGESGQPLKLLFFRSVQNGGFETGDTTSWTVYNSQYPGDLVASPDGLQGADIPWVRSDDEGNGITGTGRVSIGTERDGWGGVSYSTATTTSMVRAGNYSLELSSGGWITHTNLNAGDGVEYTNNESGFGSIHGPYVECQPFEAYAGETIYVDWAAVHNSDWYEVAGYLVGSGGDGTFSDGNETEILLFKQRGDEQDWTTAESPIDNDDTYIFRFVSGTYDETGGMLVGAYLYIDHIRIVTALTLSDATLTNIARHINYQNTTDIETDLVRDLTVEVGTHSKHTDSVTRTLRITGSTASSPFMAENAILTVDEGASGAVTTSLLKASDIDTYDELLEFAITTAPVSGQIENTDNPGMTINGFTQEDITDGKIIYIHNGSETTGDSFAFSVSDTDGDALTDQTFNITIGPVNDSPSVNTNTGGTLSENDSITVSTLQLSATDPDNDDASLNYIVTGSPVYGQLENTDNSGVVISAFTQQDLIDGKIRYLHDGSNSTSDSFNFSVSDGSTALIDQTFILTIHAVDDDTPSLAVNETGTTMEGGSLSITSTLLRATDTDSDDAALIFSVTAGPDNGWLENPANPGVSITSFTQGDIDNSRIVYFHDDSDTISGGFTFRVSDGANSLENQVFSISISPINPPEVVTGLITAITSNSANGAGTIIVDGGAAITASGLCWNTSGTPTTGASFTSDGALSGSFTSAITGLAPGTAYSVRAYATNSEGTSYGSEVRFTTDSEPAAITSQAVTSITAVSATGNGIITDLGGPNPTAHGVVWNTSGTPTTGDSLSNNGAASSTGAFSASMIGLLPDTAYYVRAFATNTAGTVYGEEVNFTTSPQAASVTSQAVSAVTTTTATGSGNITTLGTPAPTAHGVVWNTTGAPTTADTVSDIGAVASTGAFTAPISGLLPDTTYYVRTFATNTAGTVYGTEVSFTTAPEAAAVTSQAVTFVTATDATGNGNITSLGIPAPFAHGVVWNTTGAPTTADNLADNGAISVTGAFTASITGLSANTTYYVRAFVTNTAGTIYGDEVSFTTSQQVASVSSQAVSSITSTTATGNGTIVDPGSPVPTAYGVVWNTSGNPTTADSLTIEPAPPATGAYTSSITGLMPLTTYYVRAYATNPAGTVYGAEMRFTTPSQAASVLTQSVSGITATSVVVTGNIVDTGTPAASAHGIEWTSASPVASGSTNEGEADAAGEFNSTIDELIPGVEYTVTAYITNSASTTYGDELVLRTEGNSWIGGDGDWSDPSNWSRGEVPGAGDDVYIGLNTEPGNIIITVDENAETGSFYIGEAFEGAVIVSSGSSFVTESFEQAGGTFDGGAGPVDINGDFLLTGGLFTAPSGELTLEGDFIREGGEYIHNGGTIVFDGGDQYIYGDTVFNNLRKASVEAAALIFEAGTSTTIPGTADLKGGGETEPLTLECSGSGGNVTLILGSDADLTGVTSDSCVEFIYQSRGSGGLDEPQAVLSDTPAALTNGTSYSVRVSGIGVTAYRYRLDDDVIWSAETDVGTRLDFNLPAEGEHTLYVIGKDGAGTWQAAENATTTSWVIDTTAPVAVIENAPEGTVGSTSVCLNIRGEGEAAVGYKYRRNYGAWSLQRSVDVPIKLVNFEDGLYRIDVIAVDAAGNWQPVADATQSHWTVDITEPEVELTGVPQRFTSDTDADIRVSGENVVAYMYSFDGGSWTYGEISASIALSDLPAGEHTLKVRGLSETGDVGDTGGGSEVRQWVVDTTPASIMDLAAGEGTPTATSALLSWTWTSEEALEVISHYTVWFSRETITEDTLDRAVEVYCDITPSSEGITEYLSIDGLLAGVHYYFAVKSTDMAGNVSELSNIAELTTEDNLPVITTLELTAGGSTADNSEARSITITGTQFVGSPAGNIIRFENGTTVFDINNSGGTSTSLSASVPAGAPVGTYDVRVINKFGTSTALVSAYTITEASVPMPEVRIVSPQIVSAGTPTTITVTGSNFSEPNGSVSIVAEDGTETLLTEISFVDSETLTAVVDVADGFPEGFYHVRVENSDGNRNSISGMQVQILTPMAVEGATGQVETSGAISVTGGSVPSGVVLTTDERDETQPVSSKPGRIILTIEPGSEFEEASGSGWNDFTGVINPPREDPLTEAVSSQVGNYGLEFTVGADDLLRLTNGEPMLMTVEMTVPAGAPVPSIYSVGADGSISTAGITADRDGVEYLPGGVVLEARADVPEEGYVTYTIGVLLTELGNHYAAGSKATSDSYGPCFIGTASENGNYASAIFLILALFIIVLKRHVRPLAPIAVCSLLVLFFGVSKNASASDIKDEKWYLLLGAGYQHIDEKYNSLYYGTNQKLTVKNDAYPLIRGGWNFTDRISLEAGFRYDIMSGRMESNNMGGDDSVKGISVLLGPVYRFDQMKTRYIGKWTPFLKADLGYKKVNSGLSYAVRDYDPTYGIELAVGMLKGPLDLRLGYSYYSHDRKNTGSGYSAGGSSSSLGLSGIFVEVAYRFSFGDKIVKVPEVKDSDGDGVADPVDQCPGTPLGAAVDSTGCRVDSDRDGVFDEEDMCSDTPAGITVDSLGCPLDADGDGVGDHRDKCKNTPSGIAVDENGCPVDSDGDGVRDDKDKCPNTPKGVRVDRNGCMRKGKDSDKDGIPDGSDRCPKTPKGVAVTDEGCAVDTDDDGVADYLDACPETPKGATIDERGCWRLVGFRFDSGRYSFKADMFPILQDLLKILRKNKNIRLEIQGYTDSLGNDRMNRVLSEKRANAIRTYLVKYHISPSRLTAIGYGENNPVASNDTPEGRAKNRRVELKPIK